MASYGYVSINSKSMVSCLFTFPFNATLECLDVSFLVACPWDEHVGVSKNRGVSPKMDGENNGKPPIKMDDLGGKNPYFRFNTHLGKGIHHLKLPNYVDSSTSNFGPSHSQVNGSDPLWTNRTRISVCLRGWWATKPPKMKGPTYIIWSI